VLSDDERATVARLFESHGYGGPLRIARVRSEDERVFVLPDGMLARLKDARALERDLQAALHRKVQIVGDSPAWSDQAEPLR
jgi:hypothetical protein